MMLRGGGCCWSQNWGDRDIEDAQDVLVTEPEQPADPDPQAQFFSFFAFFISSFSFFFVLFNEAEQPADPDPQAQILKRQCPSIIFTT
jgi:hypothetical protein